MMVFAINHSFLPFFRSFTFMFITFTLFFMWSGVWIIRIVIMHRNRGNLRHKGIVVRHLSSGMMIELRGRIWSISLLIKRLNRFFISLHLFNTPSVGIIGTVLVMPLFSLEFLFRIYREILLLRCLLYFSLFALLFTLFSLAFTIFFHVLLLLLL